MCLIKAKHDECKLQPHQKAQMDSPQCLSERGRGRVRKSVDGEGERHIKKEERGKEQQSRSKRAIQTANEVIVGGSMLLAGVRLT